MKVKSRLLSVLILLTLTAAQPSDAAPPILEFDDVRSGMTGTGLTVFEGTRIESFGVEILGKLSNVGPDQDLILARLSGGPLARTGVLAGMSGSPVTIDGKLVGAVAYSWGFSTEPIAGITPIRQMLAITDLDEGGPPRIGGISSWPSTLKTLRSASLDPFWNELQERLSPGVGRPISIPLSISGMDALGLRQAAASLDGVGFLPLQSGGDSGTTEVPAPLEPGSAMGLKLVRGDVDMTATGTVTWVDEGRVLGFGHPLFGLGAVDLPLTGARVQALLPSLHQSARMATPLGELGSLRQDRTSGVYGIVGAEPRMIPVRLQLSASDEHQYAFDIADDPLLTPLLLYASLNGILASKERVYGQATVRLREGSVIKLMGSEDVALDNLFAGASAFDHGTGLAAYILYLLMNNTWTQPQIAGINLLMEVDEAPRTARIRRVTVDRYRASPGDEVEVAVVLRPYRGSDRVLTRTVLIPPETPAGPLTIAIGGALAIARGQRQDEPVAPRDLDQLIWLINQLRRNDRIYIIGTQKDTGILIGGARMPNLPPSVARVLTRPKTRGNFSYVRERGILEEAVLTDYAVEGSASVELLVEAW